MLKGSGVTEGGATVFTSAPQEQKQSQKWQGAKLLPSLLVLTVASVF